MAKNLKKFLSLVLALVLVLSLVPAVSATDTDLGVDGTVGDREEFYGPEEWIEIADEATWNEWFSGKNESKLMTTYGGTDTTAYVKLTADVEVNVNNLHTIGYNKPAVTMSLVLDLGGNTLTLTPNKYTGRMFGLYNQSALTVQNGTIVNNIKYGTVHGGLFFVSDGHLTLTNVDITDDTDNAYGCFGKMIQISSASCSANLTDCNITANTYNSKATLKADGTLQYGAGGIMYTSGPTTITRCTFTASNTTSYETEKERLWYGGILGVAGSTTTITDSVFNGGVARYGGAIGTSSKNAVVNVSNSSFSGGNGWYGGALCAPLGVINANNCTVEASTAVYGGAVAAVEGGAITLTDCAISKTTATTRAGALYVYGGTPTNSIEMINTTVSECSSKMGGAINIHGKGKMSINGGSITGCSATDGNGGAIALYNNGWTSGAPTITMTGLTISDCTATKGGGAIYMSNTVKYKNCMLTATDCVFSGSQVTTTGEFGGNFYIAGVDYTDAQGNVLSRSTATFTGCTFENGTAVSWGGNIGIAGHSKVEMTNCTISGGKVTNAENCGGGNFYQGNAKTELHLYNTTVKDGESANYGGNIRIGSGKLYLYSGLISGGTAGGGKNPAGHSIYLNNNADAQLRVFGGTICTNTAEAALVKMGASALNLYNCNTEGFDPSAFVVYGESYATQTGETTATVKHYAVDGATTKTGTCEEAGTVTIVCADCGQTYIYEEAAAGHAIVIDKAVAPTCTETGLTEGSHCAICATVLVAQEEIAATGHTPAEAVKENEVAHTCTTDGSYDSVIYCEVCKAELSRETGVVDPAAHTEQVVEGKAPTCTEDGLTEGKICSVCGETLVAQEPIPAAHTEKTVEGKAPTCTETGLTEGKVCEICGETLVAQEEIPVAEHAWDAGVYTDPTTEADGYTTYTCTACGETKTEIDEGSKLPEVVPSVIVKQPEAVSTDSGNDVQFSVVAEGNIVSYQWQYRKLYKWFNTSMTGYNTDTLTVAATGQRNGYGYRCIITFADGTVLTSEEAKLTVKTYMGITYHPNDQVVVLGYKGQFTAAAEGEGIKYQWQYCRPGSEKWIDTAMEGATKATVMIETTTARDGYMYRCRITDVTGNEQFTEVATMRVLSFTAHPVESFAPTGGTVEFSVGTSVPEGFTYQWQYRRNATANWTNTTMTGYNTATLTVGATLARNGYEYRCVLTGSKNSKIESKGAVLHVGDPVVITAQPADATAAVGEVATFTVVAENAYAYQWQFYNPLNAVWKNTSADGNTTNTLNVTVKSNNNNYQYRCIVYGLDGQEYISDAATLTVG